MQQAEPALGAQDLAIKLSTLPAPTGAGLFSLPSDQRFPPGIAIVIRLWEEIEPSRDLQPDGRVPKKTANGAQS